MDNSWNGDCVIQRTLRLKQNQEKGHTKMNENDHKYQLKDHSYNRIPSWYPDYIPISGRSENHRNHGFDLSSILIERVCFVGKPLGFFDWNHHHVGPEKSWGYPKNHPFGAFHKWGYPQIIHLNRIFHEINHHFWGYPIYGNPHFFIKLTIFPAPNHHV